VAHDLRWAWNHDAIELFRRLDDEAWERSGHNPIVMLGSVAQAKLERAAADPGFVAHLGRVVTDFDAHEGPDSWFTRTHGDLDGLAVAYLSAEFGITECLSIFAGGLGILAGDHLKSASDLGVPVVGVGLLYQEGYFRQRLTEAGWQQELYVPNDFHNLPVTEVRGEDGSGLTVPVPIAGHDVIAKVWRAQVGRVSLYLLDTNVEGNGPADRRITHQLYGGDDEIRLRQELVLGVGGYRALAALGIVPTVYHMNEGHSAFLVFEWLRDLVDRGLTLAEAREVAAAGLVFTTHTPVPAGHDRFSPGLIEQHLAGYAAALGTSLVDLLALGRVRATDPGETFCNTVLALHTAGAVNGVARLHGSVSRRMWHEVWPGVPDEEVPITSVTNGVHFESWVSHEMKQIYDRYLGPRWTEEPADRDAWGRASAIPDEELWRTHQRRRDRLVAHARRRLREQLASRGAPARDLSMADVVLDPHALTIGFARRFATYKRATLLFAQPERLARILGDPDRPVQIVFAGKAHPRDDAGKELIRQIATIARERPFQRSVVFIQDYDMAVARTLVQGADVWLNTPVRPEEASGTSGMKAAANGVLNLSILDGWWDEAYRPGLGWAIGRGEEYDDPGYRDEVEGEVLYDMLERDVVPTFYDRGDDHLPRRWIAMMKTAIAALNADFNTHRMVREYTERFYLPAAARSQHLVAGRWSAATALAGWRHRVTAAWPQVAITDVDGARPVEVKVAEPVEVTARVAMPGLTPDDVVVELVPGRIEPDGSLSAVEAIEMKPTEPGDGAAVFQGTVVFTASGHHGYTVRVRPRHPDLSEEMIPGLITWA
jgi:starch phosphorylase